MKYRLLDFCRWLEAQGVGIEFPSNLDHLVDVYVQQRASQEVALQELVKQSEELGLYEDD